ncbi:UDP-4-amino-4,6-dideoxy-N-acetyl-beta-L-altrosamine N-acetyltransferase [Helicobacter sp. 12S02634-8]|uniref:UDP-4-amino-4, 6-dideoxy-N-acetyl-beta-L-altrosamine N-acetyltransferase n=1 Tax=Helicobacter sp. 12S02634-8 TaxID=1476199 RepID=UPI000BA67BBB|nr:UDP-4-amino-4,6-dideoxy-N-acetyl-beta-L-altrosamine N-acetyltransferase [Helicobacter sp. 12S02634-8]PAF47547.1 UDP-4-amino-4,6-dideoxy-N-acetyl-beta-L-altrosamine N-acetyltransferase [Helicobacter sp. 12S02634-8]
MNFTIGDILALNFTHLSDMQSLEVLSFRNNPQTSRWMYAQTIFLDTHLQFITELKSNPNSHYWLFKKGQISLGVGSLTRINKTHRHGYLGLYKNPDLQNVGKEILASLEYIAFKEFALHTLHLEVMASNQKAINFYQKHQYHLEGRLIEFIYHNHTYEDALIYTKRNPYA